MLSTRTLSFLSLNCILISGNNSHGGREKTAKRNRVASAAVEPGESRLEKAEETNSSSTSVLNRCEITKQKWK